MKRFIAGVMLAALFVVIGAGLAEAQTRNSVELKFRRTDLYATLVALDPTAQVNTVYGSGSTAGYIDSVAASGAAKFDTTAWVSTALFTRPNASASIDSSLILSLHVYDAGSTAATAESLYIKCQVSTDGVSITEIPVLTGHAPVLNAWTLQTTVNAAVTAILNTSNTGLTTKSWRLGYGTAAHHNGDLILAYPRVRFILMGSRSLVHHWKAALWVWQK